MKTIKTWFLSISILCFLAITGIAQNGFDIRDGSDAPSKDVRGDLIARALELSPAQKLEIQNINQRQRQLLRVAQLRFQTARAAADLAIYDDELNETDIAAKIQEVGNAQAEITKIRMMSEVAVRNVLSPQQLVKFRALRERFAEQRRRAAERRQDQLKQDQRRTELQQRRRDNQQRPKTNNPPPPRQS